MCVHACIQVCSRVSLHVYIIRLCVDACMSFAQTVALTPSTLLQCANCKWGRLMLMYARQDVIVTTDTAKLDLPALRQFDWCHRSIWMCRCRWRWGQRTAAPSCYFRPQTCNLSFKYDWFPCVFFRWVLCWCKAFVAFFLYVGGWGGLVSVGVHYDPLCLWIFVSWQDMDTSEQSVTLC